MPLEEYKKKRDFGKTKEPEGGSASETAAGPNAEAPAGPTPAARTRPTLPKGRVEEKRPIFVVQEHQARALHWDFRLEMEGVLKSWAVPKGPPEETGVRRLAQMVEDHPLEYASFAGEIPAGQYGAGSVKIWDHGTWEAIGEGTAAQQLAAGSMKLVLHGERLKGGYALFRFKSAGEHSWLMMKEKWRVGEGN